MSFGITAQYQANELEKIQYEAARIVSGTTKLVSINALLEEVGWETLSSRRNKHKLILFYKMVNGLCPDYLCSLVPPTIGNTSRYNLRNVNDLQTLHANTQCYFNSFLPSVIREWNELSQPIRNSTSLSSFKYRLNSGATKPPSYYFEGKRLGQIYHTRLRTSCSSLNQHLFSKRSVRVAERLALPTSDHGVAGSNPAGGEILPVPKRRFIAQSLLYSPFHRLEMTEILFKGRKTLTHPSIHPFRKIL